MPLPRVDLPSVPDGCILAEFDDLRRLSWELAGGFYTVGWVMLELREVGCVEAIRHEGGVRFALVLAEGWAPELARLLNCSMADLPHRVAVLLGLAGVRVWRASVYGDPESRREYDNPGE